MEWKNTAIVFVRYFLSWHEKTRIILLWDIFVLKIEVLCWRVTQLSQNLFKVSFELSKVLLWSFVIWMLKEQFQFDFIIDLTPLCTMFFACDKNNNFPAISWSIFVLCFTKIKHNKISFLYLRKKLQETALNLIKYLLQSKYIIRMSKKRTRTIYCLSS